MVGPGDNSLADLKYLMKAKNPSVEALKAARASMTADALEKTDPTWDADFAAFIRRYVDTILKIRLEIADKDSAFVPDSQIEMNGAFQAFVRALSPDPGTVTRGSFQDLASRLDLAGRKQGDAPLVLPAIAQPPQDLSEQFLANDVVQWSKQAVDTVVAHAPGVAKELKKDLLLTAGAVGLGLGLVAVLHGAATRR